MHSMHSVPPAPSHVHLQLAPQAARTFSLPLQGQVSTILMTVDLLVSEQASRRSRLTVPSALMAWMPRQRTW